ncbi:MAG: YfhO family protein [Oscillospiraceae bacterium]
MLKTYRKSRAKQAFFLALGLSLLVFLPFVIFDKGYFFFLGDFNVQQIPFYQMAHDAVRSGDIFWNWNTDLGANFLGSYSFYLLFSPFFWLTLPFPSAAVPFLMAPLLALKTACAALTSYWYLERFLRDKYYALIGSILYAFSGFTIYNIFFNHFHEAIVFFPLLLIGVEELVVNNKRGLFTMAVAINCIINYWFFIGEVVFMVIYVFIRMTSPQWKMNLRKFLSIVFESILGLMLAMITLLPSLFAIMGNPRTTSDNILTGWNFWIYWSDQRLPAIIQSMFFPPDLPSQPNFLPEHNAKWSSMTLWLPMVSMTGVISYVLSTKKNWLKKILITSFIFAIIPGFNSAFVLFNDSYYARWYYMAILMMCLATVLAFERRTTIDIERGFRWTIGMITIFAIAIGLTPIKVDGKFKIGLSSNVGRFWGYVLFAAAGIVITWALFKMYQTRGVKFKRLLLIGISLIGLTFSWLYIGMGKCYSDDTEWIRNVAIDGRGNLETHQNPEEFFRTDIYKSMDNLGIYWQIPNIQAFHSVVPSSIMEFYPEVDIKRDVSSKPDVSNYSLRSFLSVKYHYIPQEKDDISAQIYGFEKIGEQYEFNIYENTNYLPMGFGYEKQMSREIIDEAPKDMKVSSMLNSIVLEDNETIDKYSDILSTVSDINYTDLSKSGFEKDVKDRKSQSAYYFKKDNSGFTAKSNLEKPTLMFFSVPYERGWKATVNGEPVTIEKANIGFMAVAIPSGECEIRFDFRPYGFIQGAILTIIAAFILIVYLIIVKRNKKRNAITIREDLKFIDSFEPLKIDDSNDSSSESKNDDADNNN